MAAERPRRVWRSLRPLLRLLVASASAALAVEPAAAADLDAIRPKHFRVAADIETVWQRPAVEPRGIFFIAHGCMHQGPDIFSEVGPDGWRFEACAQTNLGRCLGLPEEIRLRQAARARGYVAMAVSGGKGKQSCWDMERDPARVAQAVRHVREAEQLPEDLPVLATGASSGGMFMGRLALPLAEGGLPHLHCILPQIMHTGGLPNRGVPALYVHMPKDRRTAAFVSEDLMALAEAGVRSAEIKVGPLMVTQELLLRCLSPDQAADVLEALRSARLLHGEGLLNRDARTRFWVEPVRKALAGRSGDTLVADESCLAELLNVAWANHEFTSEFAEEMLDFCEEREAHDAAGSGRAGSTEEL